SAPPRPARARRRSAGGCPVGPPRRGPRRRRRARPCTALRRSPRSGPLPVRMRNSRTEVGRTHGPSGSFRRRPGPSLLDPGEAPFRGEGELRLGVERGRAAELREGGVALARPREQVPEVEANRLAPREARRERAEPGERGGEVALVEAADGRRDLCLVVVR